MKTIGKFTKTAIAITLAGALVAPATAAFAGEKTDRAVVGAVLGGLAGAAIGHGKGDAVAIGAVAGAALGATTAEDKRHYGHGYRTAPRYGYDNRYYDNRGYGDGRYAYERRDHRHDRYDSRYDRYDSRYAYGYRR